MICLHFGPFRSLYKLLFFTAYAHVRTEPQCDIGHTRGKKKGLPVWSQTDPVGLPSSTNFPSKVIAHTVESVSDLSCQMRPMAFARFRQRGHQVPPSLRIIWTGSGSRSDNHPTRPSTHGQTNAKRLVTLFPDEVLGYSCCTVRLTET